MCDSSLTSSSLPSGNPVLGCARPTCFGWNADGMPITQSAQFFRIQGEPDGFLRKTIVIPNKMTSSDKAYFKPQVAHCESSFASGTCYRNVQWVGGIAPIYDINSTSLSMQCCWYDALRHSTDRGMATVKPGQIVLGGEVLRDRRQYAFDYVSDVFKKQNLDGSVYYEVSIRRFPCLPMPDQLTTNVEKALRNEIINRFENVRPKTHRDTLQALRSGESPQRSLELLDTKETAGRVDGRHVS
ncbi:Warthog protein 4 [Toxocara canis]|uniref:Warthog protein 4 n=1 Tax=Toxocara canis TaxID=6265 RepID=A0A0B2UXL6_TOXCA|nr:Warthog protein 4 [Toxocara canis]